MTPARCRSRCSTRLIVDGELGARYASALEGMSISANDGLTEINGRVIDSSRLLGLIERIAGLGLTLAASLASTLRNEIREQVDTLIGRVGDE
jgi:hypothetical protein